MSATADHNERQITQMINFIMSEAQEKSRELRQTAEEAYTIEKQRIVYEEMKKIRAEFEKKEKKLAIEARVKFSHTVKQARQTILESRRECIDQMYTLVEKNLLAVATSSNYAKLLTDIAIQAAIRVDDAKIEFAVMARDKDVMNRIIPDVIAGVNAKSGRTITATLIDKPLPDQALGGCLARNGRRDVVCSNTFAARKQSVASPLSFHTRQKTIDDVLPDMRALLFDEMTETLSKSLRTPH